MAMSVSASDGEPMVDMNTTPLIDVMLVLLIMFIITLPVMTHNTNITLPGIKDGLQIKRDVIDIAVEYDGTIVYNGTALENTAQLESYLRAEAAKGSAQPELHMRPDKRAKYDRVAQVLAIAQRNGIRSIGFAGQEQYLE